MFKDTTANPTQMRADLIAEGTLRVRVPGGEPFTVSHRFGVARLSYYGVVEAKSGHRRLSDAHAEEWLGQLVRA